MNEKTGAPPKSTKPANQIAEHPPTSTRAALASAIALAVLVVGGYFLVTKMIEMRHLEDCQISGRKDCVPIEVR
jgi:hypothetical protein